MSVSAIAATSIAINNAQNKKDAHIKCENFVVGYEHEGSTVEESVQYAQCINTLYPTTTQADLMVFKGVSLTLLVCMLIGAVIEYRSSPYDRVSNTITGAITGAIMGAVAGVSLLVLVFLVFVLFL